jgi:enoyl-CoA hydratase/carnithine racemase
LDLKTIVLEKSKKTAYLMLNRPDALNGINHEMIDDLAAIIEDIQSDTYVKTVVITGAGRAFSVGADVDVLTHGFNDYPSLENFLRRLNRVLNDLETLGVPVIAAVNGVARAGGFELMLACDFVVASADARIGDNHTQFGVMPGGGATQRAPRKLGVQKAKELIFSAKWLQGQEVVDYGIALKVVPDAELSRAVEELADQFRDKSRPCLAAVKRAIHDGQQLSIEDAINLEIEVFMDYVKESPDAREGFTAYLEKRTPAWAS